MICPMMSRTVANSEETWFDRINCLQSDCAWWNAHTNSCAMVSQELERCAKNARVEAFMKNKPGPTVADVDSCYNESTIPPLVEGKIREK